MQPKIEVDVSSADAALIIQQGCHFTGNLDFYFSTQGIYQNQLKYLLHREYTCNTGMFLIVAKCYNSLWLFSKFFEMRLFHQVEVFGWLGVICYFYVKRKNTWKKPQVQGKFWKMCPRSGVATLNNKNFLLPDEYLLSVCFDNCSVQICRSRCSGTAVDRSTERSENICQTIIKNGKGT